jgi:hypothetical protein
MQSENPTVEEGLNFTGYLPIKREKGVTLSGFDPGRHM